jgi:hypothetical protein
MRTRKIHIRVDDPSAACKKVPYTRARPTYRANRADFHAHPIPFPHRLLLVRSRSFTIAHGVRRTGPAVPRSILRTRIPPASQPAKPCTALERFSATLCSAARRHSSVLSAQDITFPLPRTGVGPTSQCEGAWELWSATGKKISQDAERAGGIYNGSHFSPSLPPQPDLPARLRAPDDESCCSQSPRRSPPRSAATQSPPRQIPPPRSVARAGQKT